MVAEHYPRVSTCSCGASIVFLRTSRNKLIPIEARYVSDGTVFWRRGDHPVHFEVCPDADKRRRRRRSCKRPNCSEKIEAGVFCTACFRKLPIGARRLLSAALLGGADSPILKATTTWCAALIEYPSDLGSFSVKFEDR